MPIADTLGPMHMSNNRNFEIQRTNHFEVSFEGISRDVTLMVDSFTPPNSSVEPIELAYGNSKIKVAGQATTEDIELVIKDAIVADLESQLYEWYGKVYNIKEDKIGWSVDYKRNGRLYQYGPDGTFIRQWRLLGCFPTTFNSSEFTYDGADKKTITMTIACDKAYPER